VMEQARLHANALYHRAGIELRPRWPVLWWVRTHV